MKWNLINAVRQWAKERTRICWCGRLGCETGAEQSDRQHDMHFIKLCSYKLKLKWNDDAGAATLIYVDVKVDVNASVSKWELTTGGSFLLFLRFLPTAPLPHNPPILHHRTISGCKNLLAKQQVEQPKQQKQQQQPEKQLKLSLQSLRQSPVSQGDEVLKLFSEQLCEGYLTFFAGNKFAL